jgi:3-hydroxyisobutyrate dehydrogenase-like beta-hydroxyacid dehydrogenase
MTVPTIGRRHAREVIGLARERGYQMVDAPRFRRHRRGRRRHAHLHGGGEAQAFERARAFLDQMGKG